MEKPYVIGIDIGGTNTEFGVVNKKGEILYRGRVSTKNPDTKEDYSSVKDYLNVLIPELKKIIDLAGGIHLFRGIGIGAPNGNYNTGMIEFAPNLKWAKEESVHLTKLVTDSLSLGSVLTNDANAAAIGEKAYGAAKSLKHFIMITLGTGVGSGIVVNGYVLYGHDGFAGELGHTTVRPYNGRVCGCGRSGCLEAYASAPGISRTAREMLETDWDKSNGKKASSLRSITDRDITSYDVYVAAKNEDELAIEVFNFTGRILGEAFCNFVTFSSPEAIILFGGPAKAGELIRKPIVETMNANMMKVFKERGSENCKTKIIFSELPDADAAILGASALAWEL